KQAKHSMLSHFSIHHIPHGIDTEVYKPLDPEWCRVQLGIPSGKKVLLFAVDDLKRYLKGGDLLVRALRSLPVSLRNGIVLVLLGNGGEAIAKTVDMPTLDLGYISDDRRKVICYSAADLLAHPTRADNLPLIPLESIACGTPVVSFRIGGVPDLVR